MELNRRGLLRSLLAAIAAPAIVRVENLMVLPAKILLPEEPVVRELDILYGYMYARPEWTVAIPDIMKLDDYSERILAPMIEKQAQQIADAVMYGTGTTKFRYDGLQAPLAESVPLSQLLSDAHGATSSIE